MAYFKCGNVSGNDDSMEWKLVGSVTGSNYIKLPTDYNEIKLNTYDTNNRNTITFTISRQEIENLNILDGVNGHNFHCPINSNYVYYKSSGIKLNNFNGNGANSTTYKTYLYYR